MGRVAERFLCQIGNSRILTNAIRRKILVWDLVVGEICVLTHTSQEGDGAAVSGGRPGGGRGGGLRGCGGWVGEGAWMGG